MTNRYHYQNKKNIFWRDEFSSCMSREDYANTMIGKLGGKNALALLLTRNYIYKDFTSFACDSYISKMKREYILFELLYLLNELKTMSDEQILKYILEPDLILRNIIDLMKRKKGCNYTMSEAFDFCRCMLLDYIRGENSIVVNRHITKSALEQLVDNYKEFMVVHRIGDKCSMDIYDNQLNICDGGFYGMYSSDTRDLVKKLVVYRMHDKEIF